MLRSVSRVSRFHAPLKVKIHHEIKFNENNSKVTDFCSLLNSKVREQHDLLPSRITMLCLHVVRQLNQI
jgi:hypothetical protein